MPGIEPSQYPINKTTWTTILDFVLPAEPGREAQALERIFEFLGDTMFRSDRLLKLKIALEGAVQKSLDSTNEPNGSLPIHFRVLVSEGLRSLRFPTDNAKVAPPGCGFFLVQMTDDSALATQHNPRLEGTKHSIWLYIYGEGGQTR